MFNSISSYDLFGHSKMIADRSRTDSYVRALKAVVKPGSVVLDIGTGIGLFAVLACKFGAKKVYAIEPGDAILVARQIAIDNDCADRIEFIQGISTEVSLPDRVDIIVADLRGALPLFQQHIASIEDARQRFLAPNGLQIPQSDTIWCTLASNPEEYAQKYKTIWEDGLYDCNLTAGSRFVTNNTSRITLKPEQLVVEPQVWATLDYTTICNPHVKNTLTWSITGSITIHGIGLWFDAILAEGIGFSNAPSETDSMCYSYQNTFFPLSKPVDVIPGDRVSVTLQANLVGDDYIWSWQTQVTAGDDPRQVKANFQQSTFFGTPRSPQALHKYSDSYKPVLNESAKIDAIAIDLMAASKSLGDIAREVTKQFPHRFPTQNQALNYVAALAQKYS